MTSRAFANQVLAATRTAFAGLENSERAAGAFAYMKQIAPFIGIDTPTRRAVLKTAWAELPAPTSDELGEAALVLMQQKHREYHYAAYDLLARKQTVADEYFLSRFGAELLTTTPWWDTVDGIVNALVSPYCRRFDADSIIDDWSESGNIWLIRAAIGHQRGWKLDTDVQRVLSLCNRHWANRDFFVAKAIGWALRDLAAISPKEVRQFLVQHSKIRNTVAVREAQKGLDRQERNE